MAECDGERYRACWAVGAVEKAGDVETRLGRIIEPDNRENMEPVQGGNGGLCGQTPYVGLSLSLS
jgi:hypothetical protein